MDDVEAVKQRIDIAELVNEYVPLKRAGKNHKALCPFHNERTPSFIVSPDRQTWHCFGCNTGGDAISFLMQIEHLEFPEALRSLATRAGVSLSAKPRREASGVKEKLLAINHLAESFYHYLLLSHPSGVAARSYLAERGVTLDSIKRWKLGVAPSEWDAVRRFLHKKGYTDQDLTQAGLLMERSGGGHDRFRARLIFPLHDHHGNTVGFAGRTLGSDTPKYINTPETALFVKGDVLYGLAGAKHSIRNAGRAILVEGELDAILAAQAGTPHVVAVKGTAFTQTHIKLLKRFCTELLLSFDPDLAGSTATLRSVAMAQAEGLGVQVVALPKGSDPASLITSGKTSTWLDAVAHPQPIYDYWMQVTVAAHSLQTADGKQKIASILMPAFQAISNPVTQAHYIQRLAALLAVEEQVLRRLRARPTPVRKAPQSHDQTQDRHVAGEVQQGARGNRERHFLALLLQSPVIRMEDLGEVREDDFTVPQYRQLLSLIQETLEQYNTRGKDVTARIIESAAPASLTATVADLGLLEVLPEGTDDHGRLQVIAQARSRLITAQLKRELHSLSLQMKAAELRGSKEEMQVLEESMRSTLGRLGSVG